MSGPPPTAAAYAALGLGAGVASAAARIDAALAALRRSMLRQDVTARAIEALGLDVDLGRMQALLAVAGAAEGEEMTVGALAQRLGLDPSRASRLAADLVARGLARRLASQADARRIALALTPAGRALAEAVAAYRARRFAAVLADWPEAEAADFARLLDRFVADLAR